jgi:hypothetical protein
MLHDIDFQDDMKAVFFQARLVNGIIAIPPFNGKGVIA